MRLDQRTLTPLENEAAGVIEDFLAADITTRSINVRFVPKADSRTAAIFYCYSISRSARPTSGSGMPEPSALAVFRWNGGRISIDKSFKFNAVQQLRAVVCFNIVSFIFVTP